jgi:pimeloyl-ACP methyl ester carboxylesterase
MLPANGQELAVFEWGDARADRPSVLFLHATGFHARIWEQVIAFLPEFHCYAIDLRGHGRSSKPTGPYNWRFLAEDTVAVGAALGLSGLVGVGHSIGGHAVTLAAALQPSLFARLLLIDPVIFPPEAYKGVGDFEHYTARRRNEWKSPDEMVARFRDRPPFNTWNPMVLRDYAEYGLLPNPAGEGCVLACPPAVEAASYTYGAAHSSNIYPEIARIQIPVTILRARPADDAGAFNLSASPTTPDLAARFAHGTDVPLPQYSHFLPMEAPELVAGYVRKAVISR